MAFTLPDPTFREHAAMLLAGTLQRYLPSEAQSRIPEQWRDFRARPVPEIGAAERTYGVVLSSSENAIEYMCAIELPSFDGVNAEAHRLTLPAAAYAVFPFDDLRSIGWQWMSIYSEWLPQSGFEAAATPAFELYDRRFNARTATGEYEIWIPIVPRARD